MARRLRRYTIATDNSLTLPEFQEPRRTTPAPTRR